MRDFADIEALCHKRCKLFIVRQSFHEKIRELRERTREKMRLLRLSTLKMLKDQSRLLRRAKEMR